MGRRGASISGNWDINSVTKDVTTVKADVVFYFKYSTSRFFRLSGVPHFHHALAVLLLIYPSAEISSNRRMVRSVDDLGTALAEN